MLRSVITAEAPNSSIHRFNGFIEAAITDLNEATTAGDDKSGNAKQVPLNDKSLLLRGSILRATEWCICAVVYTGADTKLSLNSKRPPSKLSSVDRIVNRTLMVAITTMIIVCIISMFFEIVWMNKDQDASYLCIHENDLEDTYKSPGGCTSSAPSSVLTIFTFATLYNNFVCISMYVSLEMVYLCQAYFVSNDLTIYDEERDCPAECHTSGMCADLGQVQYVLSDKTGTLTKNQMIVQQFSIANKIFGKPLSSSEPTISIDQASSKDAASLGRGQNNSLDHGSGLGRAAGNRAASGGNNNGTANNSNKHHSHISANDIEFLTTSESSLLVHETLFYPALDLIQRKSIINKGNIRASSMFSSTPSSVDRESTAGVNISGGQNNTNNSNIPLNAYEQMLFLQFVRVLVYCNTAMLMPDDQGNAEIHNLAELNDRLQAESPDEVALILSAAEHANVLLEKRNTAEIVASGVSNFYADDVNYSSSVAHGKSPSPSLNPVFDH